MLKLISKAEGGYWVILTLLTKSPKPKTFNYIGTI